MNSQDCLIFLTDNIIKVGPKWPFQDANAGLSVSKGLFTLAFKEEWPLLRSELTAEDVIYIITNQKKMLPYLCLMQKGHNMSRAMFQDLINIFNTTPQVGAAIGRHLKKRSAAAIQADKRALGSRYGSYDDVAPSLCLDAIQDFDANLPYTASSLSEIPKDTSVSIHPILANSFLLRLASIQDQMHHNDHILLLTELCNANSHQVVYTPAFSILTDKTVVKLISEVNPTSIPENQIATLREAFQCPEIVKSEGQIFPDKWTGKSWSITFALPIKFTTLAFRLFIPTSMPAKKVAIDIEANSQDQALLRKTMLPGEYEDVYIKAKDLHHLTKGMMSKADTIKLSILAQLSSSEVFAPDARELGCVLTEINWK